jgi:hypothetical protein
MHSLPFYAPLSFTFSHVGGFFPETGLFGALILISCFGFFAMAHIVTPTCSSPFFYLGPCSVFMNITGGTDVNSFTFSM